MKVLQLPTDIVIAAIQYEYFVDAYEAACIDLNAPSN